MKKPEKVDQWAVNNLENELGFTLEDNRSVHFYFYFPEEYQAHHAAASLANLQFETEINYSDYSNDWLCLATKQINMTSDRLSGLRNWMEKLAQRNGGKYDGWETMIVLDDKN